MMHPSSDIAIDSIDPLDSEYQMNTWCLIGKAIFIADKTLLDTASSKPQPIV